MKILVLLLVIWLMVVLANKGKKARAAGRIANDRPSTASNAPSKAQRRRQEDDELITIILPTIHNDK